MSIENVKRALKSLLKTLTLAYVIFSVSATETLGGQPSTTYPPLPGVLQLERPQLTIGTEAREGPDLFGAVRSVVMDAMKNIFVLDPTAHTVRVFGPNGTFLTSLGRSGRGPGDFADPLSLAHDGGQALFVVDRYNGISVFKQSNGKLTYKTRFGAELSPTSACVLGDTLVVAGVHSDRLLHMVSMDGKVVRSFGTLFRPDSNPVVREMANSGRLVVACDKARELLFLAEASGERVRAYSRSGSLIWEQSLPDFRGSRVVPDGRRPGSFAVILPVFDTETLLPLGEDLLLVQAHHQRRRRAVSRDGSPTTTSIDSGVVTYVLSASSGHVITRAYQGPFLSNTVAGMTVGYDDDPFPHVVLLKATELRKRDSRRRSDDSVGHPILRNTRVTPHLWREK